MGSNLMNVEYRTLAILTALPIERDAILRRLSGVEEIVRDGRTSHRGKLDQFDIVVECFQGMGNIKSGVRTAQAIERWNPSAALLVGITGGTKKSTSSILTANDHWLGDVLVAEQIVDYESGKLVAGVMENRPEVYRSSHRLIDSAKNLKTQDWTPSVCVPRPDGTSGRVNPTAHFGVVASGQRVLKDQTPLTKVSTLFSNLVGVEMEGFGAAMAALDRVPPVEFLLVKGICDWADPEKNDQWHPYAADVAAAYLIQVVRRAFDNSSTVSSSSSPGSPSFVAPPKLVFRQRLGDSWPALADALRIPAHDCAKFTKGEEPSHIWEWLKDRNKLDLLDPALRAIDRGDLAEHVTSGP